MSKEEERSRDAISFVEDMAAGSSLHFSGPAHPCVTVRGQDLSNAELSRQFLELSPSEWWSRLWTDQGFCLAK